jgi:hypothetical protein
MYKLQADSEPVTLFFTFESLYHFLNGVCWATRGTFIVGEEMDTAIKRSTIVLDGIVYTWQKVVD